MAGLFSATINLLPKTVLVVGLLLGGSAACGGEPSGSLEVRLELRDQGGLPLSCEDLGATQIAVALYAQATDTLVYDRVVRDCEIAANGSGQIPFNVAVGTYHRAEIRLLGASGNTVRLCSTEGTMDGLHTVENVTVSAGETRVLEVDVQGTPGSCPP